MSGISKGKVRLELRNNVINGPTRRGDRVAATIVRNSPALASIEACLRMHNTRGTYHADSRDKPPRFSSYVVHDKYVRRRRCTRERSRLIDSSTV